MPLVTRLNDGGLLRPFIDDSGSLQNTAVGHRKHKLKRKKYTDVSAEQVRENFT